MITLLISSLNGDRLLENSSCIMVDIGSCFLVSEGTRVNFSAKCSSWESVRPGFLLYAIDSCEKTTEENYEISVEPDMRSCTDIVMEPHLASRIVYSLRESKEFRMVFHEFMKRNFPGSWKRHPQPVFRIILDWSQPNKFDEPWEYRIWTLCMWNELVREHLAWLSTLGGAFSSLGKIGFSAFAEKAGKISVSQWRLSTYIGDAILSSRSRIFYAISLIQRRQFRVAQDILRKELQFSRSEVVAAESKKLESIIRSVWDYLVHEKQRRQRSRLERKQLDERAARLMFDDGTIKSKKSLADTILAISHVKLPQGC